jgi:phosphohistidine phosphatase
MFLFLVHHADAVGPGVDSQRPLSPLGRTQAEAMAARAKAAGCAPAVIWHSGKLRARQTAEAYHRLCNPFAEFKMVRGLLPEDPPQYVRDLVVGETRDMLAAGHMPNIRAVLAALDRRAAVFPLHGVVALESTDEGRTWSERWRAAPE